MSNMPTPMGSNTKVDQLQPSGFSQEADLAQTIEAYPERANLFLLTMLPMPTQLYCVREQHQGRVNEEIVFTNSKGASIVAPKSQYMCRAIQQAILQTLKRHPDYKVSTHSLQPLIVDTTRNHSPKQRDMQILQAFRPRIMEFGGNYWLCLDHQLIERSLLHLNQLEKLDPRLHLLPGQRMWFYHQQSWIEGKLLGVEEEACHLELPSGEKVSLVKAQIVPDLTRPQIARLAPALGIPANEHEQILKRLSFLTIASAPRARLDACTQFAQRLANEVFPIKQGAIRIDLQPIPAILRPPAFELRKDLDEGKIAFDHTDHSKRLPHIRKGLERFGAYDKPSSPMRLLVVSTKQRATSMRALFNRLNQGSQHYPGSQRMFGSNFQLQKELACDSVKEYEETLREFVHSSAFKDIDVALIYLPREKDSTDPSRPYIRVKRLLVQEGLASQMVDEMTVLNPEWRDLNLGLNLFAKAGHVPWVLENEIPNIDLFIGLSYSQVRRRNHIVRMMAYVNVFDAYGRWHFYQSDSLAFPFEDRLDHYSQLVRNSLAAYRAEHGGPLKSIQIHLTKRFSSEERAVLARAVRTVAPDASVVFVSVNTNHPLRLYDLSENSDGNIMRATYLTGGSVRVYLATTGKNAFNEKGMGTPVPLELTVWADPVGALPPLSEICQQILSLTRLNWASSRNFCQEPITTKFAGDISNLMTDFLEDPTFFVNPRLRDTPWFL